MQLISGRGLIFTLAMCAMMLCFSKAHGQYIIEALPRWQVSGFAFVMLPGSPVDRFVDDDQWGYQLDVQYRLQYNKPFLAGLYFNEAGISKYVLEYQVTEPDGVYDIREKANTRRIEFGASAGFYPEINWLLQPYLVGRAGVAIYQSSSVLTDGDTKEPIDRIAEMSSAVVAYGLDFGIHIVPNIWYLRGDIRIGLTANPSVTFLTLDEENKGDTGYPIEYFEEHTSSGQWLRMSAGITYLF